MGDTVTVGSRTFVLEVREQGGQWTVEPRHAGSGTPAGPPVVAPTAEDATARAMRWLEWQQEHAGALERLQDAERTYHRLVTGNAFGSAELSELQRDALQQLEQARQTLDAVRLRQP